MPGTLRLTRQGIGIELRRGPFDVTLDDKPLGTIERGETVQASLDPGRHTLRIRSGRSTSPPRSFTSADDDVVSFRCHGAMMWPRYLASIVVPNLAISLHRE